MALKFLAIIPKRYAVVDIIPGTSALLQAIKSCWASQYSYRAVEYRKQNCLPLTSSMGVLVQHLIHAEVAGVMFTVNPTTRTGDQVLITGNYGLGESVVSGIAEPDTFIVGRADDALNLQEVVIGSKLKQV